MAPSSWLSGLQLTSFSWLGFLHGTLLDRYHTALVSPISWDLHHSQSFTYAASHNDLLKVMVAPAIGLVSAALKCRGRFCNPFTQDSFAILKAEPCGPLH